MLKKCNHCGWQGRMSELVLDSTHHLVCPRCLTDNDIVTVKKLDKCRAGETQEDGTLYPCTC